MNHTPTPWYVSGLEIATNLNMPYGKKNRHIASVTDHYPHGTPQDHATAEFIVRACNCHDELVEACKEAYNLIGILDEHANIWASEAELNRCIIETDYTLKQALAKAQG